MGLKGQAGWLVRPRQAKMAHKGLTAGAGIMLYVVHRMILHVSLYTVYRGNDCQVVSHVEESLCGCFVRFCLI